MKDIKSRLRAEAADEARQADEQEERISRSVQKWKSRTTWLGIALGGSIASVVPFLYGFPLHYLWDMVGTKLLFLSMVLVFPFLWTAATLYNFCRYQRDITAIHRKFAPPGSKYRTGNSETSPRRKGDST